MNSDTAAVGRRIVSASGWTISTRFLIRGVGVASTAVLARLLVPEDFGLIAMAMVLYQILEALSEFNFNAVLLVERKAGRDYYDTVWTLAVIRGVAEAAILCLLAAPASVFFDEPRIELIVYSLAAVALLGGANNVGIVEFQKEFRFGLDLVYMRRAKGLRRCRYGNARVRVGARMRRSSRASCERPRGHGVELRHAALPPVVDLGSRGARCSVSRGGCCYLTCCTRFIGASTGFSSASSSVRVPSAFTPLLLRSPPCPWSCSCSRFGALCYRGTRN